MRAVQAKARQKNFPKVSTGEKATVINGRWFHDNSTLKVHKGETGTSKIWDLTVDELTGLQSRLLFTPVLPGFTIFFNFYCPWSRPCGK